MRIEPRSFAVSDALNQSHAELAEMYVDECQTHGATIAQRDALSREADRYREALARLNPETLVAEFAETIAAWVDCEHLSHDGTGTEKEWRCMGCGQIERHTRAMNGEIYTSDGRYHAEVVSDPETEHALYLNHLEAGIEKLEGSRLSLEHRNAVARLAERLIRLSRKENA